MIFLKISSVQNLLVLQGKIEAQALTTFQNRQFSAQMQLITHINKYGFGMLFKIQRLSFSIKWITIRIRIFGFRFSFRIPILVPTWQPWKVTMDKDFITISNKTEVKMQKKIHF